MYTMKFKTSSKILLTIMTLSLVAFIFLASAAADDPDYLSFALISFGTMLSFLFGFIFNEIG